MGRKIFKIDPWDQFNVCKFVVNFDLNLEESASPDVNGRNYMLKLREVPLWEILQAIFSA